MKALLITIAAAALAAGPLAAQAQDRDGYQRDGYARPAADHGRDANAQAFDRRGEARYGRAGREGYARGGFAGDRLYWDRRGFSGGVTLGFGYDGAYRRNGYGGDGYYGGYYDAGPAYEGGYPSDVYGAGYAYAYPDRQGTYQPFDYAYSDRDDAYYAAGGGAPNVGWSAGGPPVDCGRWVWRQNRGAYQWVARACPCPQ